jgi:hypothetical protein
MVRFLGKPTRQDGSVSRLSVTEIDPGRVKTQKGRLRRGIAFYRRCEFRVVLLPVARTSRWRGRSFYAFLTLRRFRMAKTRSCPGVREIFAVQHSL